MNRLNFDQVMLKIIIDIILGDVCYIVLDVAPDVVLEVTLNVVHDLAAVFKKY